MSLESVVDQIRRAGGVLKLEGDHIRYLLPNDVAHLAGELKEYKPELLELLRREGGRIATFPHCPKCASYALYRENSIGAYECQSCGLQGIEEQIARRLQ
jgi:hypothetical protein